MRRRPAILLSVLAIGGASLVVGATASAVPAPPTISLAPGAFTNQTSATFEFTHGDPLVTFECRLDGAAFTPCASPKDYTELAEATHSFAVVAVDPLGPSDPVVHTWTIDVTAPTVTVTSPAPDALVNDATPTLSGTAGTAPGDSPSVGVTIRAGTDTGGKPLASFSAPIVPETGAWAGEPPTPLADGTYTAKVEQSDQAGNHDDVSRTFTIDTLPPPTPSLTGPQNPTTSTSATFSFSDSEPGVTFACRLDGAPFAPCTSPRNYSSLSDGEHTFAVTARDGAGNESTAAVHTWTIDTTAPVVVLTSPPDGTATADATPAFSGIAGTTIGDVGIVTISLWAGSATTGTPEATATASVQPSTGHWSIDWSSTLASGVYSARAQQVDAAGNVGVSTKSTFEVDLSVPAVTIDAPATGTVTSQRQPTFSGAAGPGTVTVEVFAGADPGNPAAVMTPTVVDGAWSVTPPGPLADGTYTVVAQQTNALGVTGSSAAVLFTVDTTPPAPVLGFSARAGNRHVSLAWQRPADVDYRDVVIQRTPVDRELWTTIVVTRDATQYTDRGVVNNRVYAYRAVSRDSVGNTSAPVSQTARPSAFYAPAWNALVTSPPTLRWSPVRRASYYNVQVWRNGRKVLSRWPLRARYTMEAQWRSLGRRFRFTSGTYYAYAWPGFGPKALANYGRIIGWTRFVVP